jgi:hypothetical protein
LDGDLDRDVPIGNRFIRVSDNVLPDDRNVAISQWWQTDCAVNWSPAFFGGVLAGAICRLGEPTGDDDEVISLVVLAIANPSAHRRALGNRQWRGAMRGQ